MSTSTASEQGRSTPVPDAAASPRRRRGSRIRVAPWVGRALILLALIGAWEIVCAAGWVDPLLLPSPIDTVRAMGEVVTQSTSLTAFEQTGKELLLAFLIGTGIGFAIGLILARITVLRRAYFPVVLLVMSTPKVIFLPAFLVVFGLSTRLPIAYGAFEASVYVIVNVVGGFDLVDPRHLRVARAFGSSRLQEFITVIVPAALPGFVAALWYGAKNAFTGVLLAELFASYGGVGNLVKIDTQTFQIASAFALVILVSLVVVVIGGLWNMVEARAARWRSGVDPVVEVAVGGEGDA